VVVFTERVAAKSGTGRASRLRRFVSLGCGADRPVRGRRMSASPTQPIRDRSSRFENHLLAAMPEAEFRRWAHHIELVDMELGQVITEPGVELPYAYFPVTAIVSLLYVMRNGESAEIALVGNDGLVGVTLFMGGNSSTIRAVVQSAGKGYRLPASALEAEVARGGATLRLLLLYTQSLVTQMTQTAACNKHHSLNQQFCRWLLLSFDRLQGDEMVMTQKLIAKMLGVQNGEVTVTATALQASGAISYRAGRITLLDRAILEAASCECYEVVKRECNRLLPQRADRLAEKIGA
jgi:CRP-like cAMP-binding protein